MGEGDEGARDHPDGLGSPESLGTAKICTVLMSQSQVEKVITEGSLTADAGCICTLCVGVWVVGKGSCLPVLKEGSLEEEVWG